MRSSANCAAFLDKATDRNDLPGPTIENPDGKRDRSEYASYRDAFFILSVMNQFTININFNGAAAEKLLKVALFSKQLRLPLAEAADLEEARQALARDTREARKRGTVQCFLSQLWFIFGMVISIQSSFGLLGQNAPAQNLALGLAMVWFPVLMLCTVVDRNPAIPENTQRQLNTFLGLVREALFRDVAKYRIKHDIFKMPKRATTRYSIFEKNPIRTLTFHEAIAPPSAPRTTITDESTISWFDSDENDSPDLSWIDSIADPALDHANFFVEFAGQGRHMFHYGVAYPIVEGLKKDGIVENKRGWLYTPDTRRRLIATKKWDAKDRLHSWDLREFWQVTVAFSCVWASIMSAFVIAYFTPTVGLGCRSLGYLLFGLFCTGQGLVEMIIWALTPHHKHQTKFYKRARYWGTWFINVSEACNTIWLVYIIFAQALGSYNTCKCKCSNYGIVDGGYINLDLIQTPDRRDALVYWLVGTIIGFSTMIISIVFIAWEWVTQSHMSTENYDSAMGGLRTTRRFKRWTRWFAPLQA